jgi:hypothetical protein
MSRDMKNSFYRTLHLDKETNEILKWYRKNVKNILNDAESKTIIKKGKE